ncbi:Zn2/Cys6 DNA-binding protein [Glarea lozoyensis ATCC 20868]|uniref:Zn2/Cys6 DNA-binding protein n=1 Tax=Glarea lozoyensis (strain ATCC 20868 / MF5171) TaxID=1116229 RepID=S3CYS5_GLAL2|nr:Zn2/Cys6 DNA-binding protein [Glarea lozoyensis ATCC 20868]EPE30104.1 Zn2/Cys6 DNA-binding protein [Glarea lozoyensis ATCC 20868]
MKRARVDESADKSEDHVTKNSNNGAKIPSVRVSKTVKACTECQNRKIRCDLAQSSSSSCTRCIKKGLKCTLNKSLQSILVDEAEWKMGMQNTSQQLQAAVSEILGVLNLPPLETFASPGSQPVSNVQRGVRFGSIASTSQVDGTSPLENMRSATPRTMAMTRENSNEPEHSHEGSGTLVGAPINTLYEVTRLRHLRGNPRSNDLTRNPLDNDFISRGVIGEKEAQELFDTFNHSLNHYLWGGIALVHSDLTSVRKSSSLLLTAILAVTALHAPGGAATFDICYSEFTSLVSSSMLDRHHTLDGIRGLCIAAFWLSDLSWKLSGHAVRIATELNLHRSFAKALRGEAEHIEAARLWYLLYVCDHHFSIAYGRPPVIHEDQAVVGHERFLQLPGITQADLRLHSQIAIFSVLTKMFHSFGPDVDHMLQENDLHLLGRFNMDLDNWRIRWESQLAPNPFISSYPSKGVSLHHHFGKLQLNALSLRGFQESPHSTTLSTSRREYANLAISSAVAILQLVISSPDIRNGLVGVPLYLHTMITYAAVFLLKVEQRWKPLQLGTDSILIRELVTQIIQLLKSVKASERFLAAHIAIGLQKMLERERPAQNQLQQQYEADLAPFGVYGNSFDLFDENYFPVGFFDVSALNGVGGYDRGLM